jgi:hypothetical protein
LARFPEPCLFVWTENGLAVSSIKDSWIQTLVLLIESPFQDVISSERCKSSAAVDIPSSLIRSLSLKRVVIKVLDKVSDSFY